MPTAAPRSAYIHVPFCQHRCGYCDFAVIAGRDDLIEPYFDALAIELSWLGEPRPVDTLYFGGGTPSYLDPEKLTRLCELVGRWHPLAAGAEWTVEANPESVTRERLETLARHGANRLSLGAQSFDEAKLRALDRFHVRSDIERSNKLAREFGLHVGVDLIFAAPSETLEAWRRDLQAAIDLAPDHISTYGLTWEHGTAFTVKRDRGELSPIEEDIEREMYAAAIGVLTDAGYEHYEVSNFARPGRRSRHNETYWAGNEYFAAGPGAARYVAGVRETNLRSTTGYLNRVLAGQSPVADREQLEPERRAREQLVFGLRRMEGVDRDAFAAASGFQLDKLAGPAIARFVDLNLLADDGKRIQLTREGLFVSDALWPELL